MPTDNEQDSRTVVRNEDRIAVLTATDEICQRMQTQTQFDHPYINNLLDQYPTCQCVVTTFPAIYVVEPASGSPAARCYSMITAFYRAHLDDQAGQPTIAVYKVTREMFERYRPARVARTH